MVLFYSAFLFVVFVVQLTGLYGRARALDSMTTGFVKVAAIRRVFPRKVAVLEESEGGSRFLGIFCLKKATLGWVARLVSKSFIGENDEETATY